MVSYRVHLFGVVDRHQALWLIPWPQSQQIATLNGLSRREAKSHAKPSAKKCKTNLDVKGPSSCSAWSPAEGQVKELLTWAGKESALTSPTHFSGFRLCAAHNFFGCRGEDKKNNDPARKLLLTARQEKLTPEQRREIAQKAIRARWAKAKKKKTSS